MRKRRTGRFDWDIRKEIYAWPAIKQPRRFIKSSWPPVHKTPVRLKKFIYYMVGSAEILIKLSNEVSRKLVA